MKKRMLKGFTLAEVLIALTIIGVVSALTIPTLVQKTNKQEYVSALQKTYSTLSQAAQLIIAENGSPKCDDGGWACSRETVYNMYKKYLNNVKDCGSGAGKGCFTQGYHKNLNGGYNYNYDSYSEDSYRLVTADGVQMLFADQSNNCSRSWNGSENICAEIWADVNGAKKPNQWGRDYFMFVIKESGLYPMGCDKPDENRCGNKDNTGWGCACKVLTEGKMDY